MEYAIAKLKTAEIVRIDVKHLADTDISIIFVLYINGYGERCYIVQA